MNSRTEVLARLRGAAVGSFSGTVGIAAHGVGGGHRAPDDASLVLLLAACALVGVATASLRVRRCDGVCLAVALVAGQVLGHTALSIASHHPHQIVPSAPMLTAHALAVVLSFVLIRGVEHACVRAVAAVTRIVLAILSPARVVTPLWSATPTERSTPSLWSLVLAVAGTRGPPVFA